MSVVREAGIVNGYIRCSIELYLFFSLERLKNLITSLGVRKTRHEHVFRNLLR